MNYVEYQGFLDPDEDTSVLVSKYNKPLTSALFIDRTAWADVTDQRIANGELEDRNLYTLKEREVDGYPSAYQIYMHSSDEYEAAMKLVGSLYHWTALMEKDWFMKELKEWRKHMALRDYSTAKSVVLKDAKNGDGPAARKIMDAANKVLNPVPAKIKKTKPGEDTATEEDDFAGLMEKHLGPNVSSN